MSEPVKQFKKGDRVVVTQRGAIGWEKFQGEEAMNLYMSDLEDNKQYRVFETIGKTSLKFWERGFLYHPNHFTKVD